MSSAPFGAEPAERFANRARSTNRERCDSASASDTQERLRPSQPALLDRPQCRIAIWITLAIVAISLGYSTIYRAAWGKVERSDFTVYTAAGDAFLQGRDIYQAHNTRGWLYMYLPIFAVVMVPLAQMSTAWAVGVWYVLSLLMLAHTIWMSTDLAQRYWPDTRYSRFELSMWVLLGVLWPAWSGLARGQASLMVAWLVTLGVWALICGAQQRPRRWLAGAALAGAIVLKVFPGLFLPYFLFKRRWPLVLTTGAWLVLLMFILPGFAFGFRQNVELLQRWVTTVAMPANDPDDSADDQRYRQMINPRIERNQSVNAVMVRLLAMDETKPNAEARQDLAETIGKVIRVALLLLGGWACTRALLPAPTQHVSRPASQSADDDGGEQLLSRGRAVLLHASIVILLMLFLSAVSWVHSFMMMAIPLAALLAIAGHQRAASPHSRRCLRAYHFYLAASLIAVTVKPLHVLGILLLATLVVFAVTLSVLLTRAHRPGRAPAA